MGAGLPAKGPCLSISVSVSTSSRASPLPQGWRCRDEEYSNRVILVGQSLQQLFHLDDGILSAPPISGALPFF
ncbi:hypothetical protein EGT09_16260 [Pseudomonas putida]|uniref:Uncharacterized protein n=1 Tax=Pseudomonas putida TaxID=303 RepID=A0AAD0L5X7_PSEPU|nr:hypothetical protein C1S65_02255 [Pseudomonas putida]RSC27884.1 hypothetical protein EGT09_16260 [Pseudomonas putida]